MLGIFGIATLAILIGAVSGPVSAQNISVYHCSLSRTGFWQSADGVTNWAYQDCAQGTVCFPDYNMTLSQCRFSWQNTCETEGFQDVRVSAGTEYPNSILYCDEGTKTWLVEECPYSEPAQYGEPTTAEYGTAQCVEGPVYGYIVARIAEQGDNLGAEIGYLSYEQGFNTSFRILDDFEKALRVSANYTSGRFSILGVNTWANKVNLWVGAVATGIDEDFDLSNTTGTFAIVTGTQRTELGATPQFAGNSYSALKDEDRAIESAIWSASVETGELFASWVNSDESVVSATIAVNVHHPYTYFPRVFLTGNFELFRAAIGGVSTRVRLFFELEGGQAK